MPLPNGSFSSASSCVRLAVVTEGAAQVVNPTVWDFPGDEVATVIVNGYTPPVPVAGVPDSVAVPLPLSVNVMPSSEPLSLSVVAEG